MTSLQLETPIYFKRNGVTDEYQHIGLVRMTCDHTDGKEMADAIQNFITEYTSNLNENFVEDFILIGGRPIRNNNTTPQDKTDNTPQDTPQDGEWDFKTGPTYIMKTGDHVICPMCWDGNFGVPAGTHQELTDAEVGWCVSKKWFFAMCRKHQDEYKKHIGLKTFFGDNNLFGKLKSIKGEVDLDADKGGDYIFEIRRSG